MDTNREKGGQIFDLDKSAASPHTSDHTFLFPLTIIDRTLEEEAEDILEKHQGQDFSYADAVSFAAMKQERIKMAFSFDRHFVTAGFRIIP